MKRTLIVTVITFAVAAGCATSPRAAPGTNPNVSPRDTTAADTTMRDTTTTTLPDTSATPLRLSIDR